MKRNLLFFCILIAGIAACFSACNKEETTPPDNKYTALNLPSTPYSYNSLFASDEMIALGRVLFYDGNLSVNSSISCGTCHKQVTGFAGDDQTELGFKGKSAYGKAALLQNLAKSNFTWDGSENSQSTDSKPVFNHAKEVLDSKYAAVQKIQTASYYKKLFADAFGTETITIEKVNSALSAFTGSISPESKITDPKFSNPFKQ